MTEILGVGELLWDVADARTPGGAPYNFAFHCRQLGHPSAIVSRVGDDEPGRLLREHVRAGGVDDAFVQIDASHPTGEALVHGGGESYTITPDVAWDFLRFDDGWDFSGVRAVCFGTLAQRHPVARQAIRRLLDALPPAALVVCDLNIRRPLWSVSVVESSLHRAKWLKLSESELGTLTRWFGLDADGLRSRFDLELVCVTRGPGGAIVRTAGESVEVPGIPPKTKGDTVGAGDAFTAALVCRSLEGANLADAVKFANSYASLVAGRIGGTPVIDRAEVIG